MLCLNNLIPLHTFALSQRPIASKFILVPLNPTSKIKENQMIALPGDLTAFTSGFKSARYLSTHAMLKYNGIYNGMEDETYFKENSA